MGREFLFQHYLVAFLDILGQRESLRRLTALPTKEEEKTKFIAHIRQSYGKVARIRNYFKEYFDASDSYITNVNVVASEHHEQFLASQRLEVSFYGFSDSIVICVPLMSNDENCTAINGIYSAFVAASGIGLFALSEKIPVRGGLDVGIATEIEKKEIYGPALERAVHLEHQISEYPRFVIGNELLNYLTWVENQEYISPLGKIAMDGARSCKEMIIRDTDGRYMLDFLGPKLKEMVGNPIRRETVIAARNFVEEEYTKYTQQDNEMLMFRYFRLLNYFQHRQDVWESS
jgi:hypothetical protein